ncbi:hypothetical protein CathTA2_0088 [Caldalkalibacillus thermarum TA2.A1]|uniref:Uncharacterized protein n=1 Tax=Caldalkalibacillus thermarum (strain TA2.A1) TaxID=986075 RepID=F5LBA0_CALTT|nr:hypothetical protein CathTA2_0088 [Caldalkalibacillus thermarum TA2.A1]
MLELEKANLPGLSYVVPKGMVLLTAVVQEEAKTSSYFSAR